jgi:UDP-2,3-diacylglucosamine pyrophosphatase LpxH
MAVHAARTHLVVISDLHLGEPEPSGSAWQLHRQRRFFPDDDVANLAREICARLGPGDRLEWVFGGDVFELDGARVIDGVSHFADEARGPVEAREALVRVVEAHAVLFDAVARLVAAGHRVVFVAGNHDAQLAYPEVADTLVEAILTRATAISRGAEHVDDLRARVRVRPWFHRTLGDVHVEHGHQYDPYCAFRNPVAPFDPRTGAVADTMGALAFRHLVHRMGFFNAHDDRSFMLSIPAYAAHWARNYLFSKRSLAYTWFRGALRTVAALVRARPNAALRRAIAESAARDLARYVEEAELPKSGAARHAALFAETADTKLGRVMRELHLDQVICLLVAAIGVALFVLTHAHARALGGAMVALAAAFPLLQQWASPKRALVDDVHAVDALARRLADVYPTRAVVFGHTHMPHAVHDRGVLVVNSGAWTPPIEETDAPADAPRTPNKPFVWLSRAEGAADAAGRAGDAGTEDDALGPLEGGLFRFRGGEIYAVPTRSLDGEETRVAPVPQRRPSRLSPSPAE